MHADFYYKTPFLLHSLLNMEWATIYLIAEGGNE